MTITALTIDWTDTDIDSLLAFCNTLDIADPIVPIAVWMHESQCRADAHNPGGAAGILQLEPGTAKQLGYNVAADPKLDAFCKLSVTEQLTWAVKYFALARGRLNSVGAFYTWDFLPSRIGIAGNPQGIVCSADDENPEIREAYADNWEAFDPGKRGYIEVADLTRTAMAAVATPRGQELLARARRRMDTLPELPPVPSEPEPVDIGPASSPSLPTS